MKPNPSSSPTSRTGSIREKICLQMEREALSLQTVHSALEQIHEALCSGSPDLISRISDQHEAQVQQIEKDQQLRERFCQEMADSLQLASTGLRLSDLLRQLPPEERTELLQKHHELRQQAEKVEKLFNRNATLIFSGLDFLHRFFRDLAGGQKSSRYGADGKSGQGVPGTLLEIQG